jgi:hypothetical protein
MECGSNYSRSMASYSLLLAYSGFSYDMNKFEIGFSPLRNGKFFWSLDKAWGIFEQDEKGCAIRVLYGIQELRRIFLNKKYNSIALNGTSLLYKFQGGILVLENPVIIKAGESLCFA